jgi:integrase
VLVKITKRTVDAMPVGKSISDTEVRGFRARRLPSGTVNFELRYTSDAGLRSWIKLGEYGAITPDEARTLAKKRTGEVAAGKDPGAHKRGAHERAFAVLADRYLNEHARRFKKTAEADAWALTRYVLPHWQRRDYTALERADLIKLVEGIIAGGAPVMANRVQALVSSVFSFALDADLIKAHPFMRLRMRGQERTKTRVLSDDEIRLFWRRSAETPAVSRATGLALRLVLVLGARVGEIAGMKTRGELEFQKGKPVAWTLPAERAKNERALLLPLPPLAVELIGEALTLAEKGSDAVFSRDDRPMIGHDLTRAMRRLGAALPKGEPGADTWRADPPTCHDLRRSAATRMGAAGVPTEDVAAILNHVSGGVTTKHYNLYDRAAEKARALRRWSTILSAILKPSESDVVVPLRR